MLGKLSEQLQLVAFIPSGVESTVRRMVIQTRAGLPLLQGHPKDPQQLSAAECVEQKLAESLATKCYNQLLQPIPTTNSF